PDLNGSENYRSMGRNIFYANRSMSAKCADLEQFAVIAGFLGNPELATAIEPGHHRHHGDDVLASCLLQRALHVALLAELDQVARGRERQLEAPVFAAFKRLARRDPDRVGGFLTVMGTELVRRSGGEEKPGVETFRHALRRDPVRVGHEFIECEYQAVPD